MKKTLIVALFVFVGSWLQAQNVTISGYVKDASNGEALIGVSVYSTSPRYGTVTNS